MSEEEKQQKQEQDGQQDEEQLQLMEGVDLLADTPQFLVDAINQANFALVNEEVQMRATNQNMQQQQESKTSNRGNHIGKSKSQLNQIVTGDASMHHPPNDSAASRHDLMPSPLNVKPQDSRFVTQGPNHGFMSRQSSPNQKQSVLVKRVMQDGRVVSGLDNNPSQNMLQGDDQEIDEDQGTLVSNGDQNMNKDALARESNVVNYATGQSNESRLRSTIYISGKSQKFALGGGQGKPKGGHQLMADGQPRGSPSSIRSPISKTMIINLGERTQTSRFPAGVLRGSDQMGDMVVGVTDIATGATHLQVGTSGADKETFSPKLKHKQLSPKSSLHGSGGSGNIIIPQSGSPTGIQHTTAFQKFNETGVQITKGDFATPSPGYYLSYEEKAKYDNGLSKNDPLMISQMKLSHEHQFRQSPTLSGDHRHGMSGTILENTARKTSPQVTLNVKQQQKQAELVVTNVDPREMIPSRPGRPDQKQEQQHKRSMDRIAPPRDATNSKSPRSPPVKKQILPNELRIQQFHQQQALNYKNYIKSNADESRFNSQHTLLGQTTNEEDAFKTRSGPSLSPERIKQINQGSSAMLHAFEDQINQLKSTNSQVSTSKAIQQPVDEKFFVDNPLKRHDATQLILGSYNSAGNEGNLMQASPVAVKQMISHTQVNTGNAQITRESFKLSERGDPAQSTFNSKMLSTYRGADNMKLKIIDQSVLKSLNTSHNTTMKLKQQNAQTEFNPTDTIRRQDVDTILRNDGVKQPLEPQIQVAKRKSIIYSNLLEQRGNVPILPIRQQEQLTPFESHVMKKASPLSKIESFRALLREESVQNELLIMNNQENFKSLINPEVTRKEYTILGRSPSKEAFFIGNSQNQSILTRKGDEMLHTVTDEFLDDRYHTGNKTVAVSKSQKIAVDPQEFRAKLSKKIEELRRLEVSDSQIIKEFELSQRDSIGSVPGSQGLDSAPENSLFMTFLQHGNNAAPAPSGRNQMYAASTEESSRKNATLRKQLTKALEKASSEFHIISADSHNTRQKVQKTRFEMTDITTTPGSINGSEKVLIQQHNYGTHREIGSQNVMATIPATATLEASLTSFTSSGEEGAKQSRRHHSHKKSRVTLAESGSNATIQRVARRYQREQRIVIFEDGASMSATTPCFQFELNSLLQQYYLRQKGDSQFTTHQEDVTAQLRMYERAIVEILDNCGSRLCDESQLTPEEITKLDGAAPKVFNRLMSIYGQEIRSLIEIDEDVCLLIAGDKKTFKGLKTDQLFKTEESALQMLNRIVNQSPIKFDKKSTMSEMPLNFSESTKRTTGPMRPSLGLAKLQQSATESPGKTFDLTQMSASIDESPRKSLKVGAKRYVSINTSRDIIRESRQELVNQLTSSIEQGNHPVTVRNRVSNHSSVNSHGTRQKRLAQIQLISKGIRKGRLPPIKTPKQLDVFVFGEQQGRKEENLKTVNPATLQSRHQRNLTVEDQYQRDPLSPQLPLHQTMTIPLDLSQSLISTEFGHQAQQHQQFEQKRGTQVHHLMNSGQSLLNSIKHNGTITSPDKVPRSSLGSSAMMIHGMHQQHQQHQQDGDGIISSTHSSSLRRAALSVSLKKNLEAVNSVQRIIDRSRTSAPAQAQEKTKKQRYRAQEEQCQPNDHVRGKNLTIAQMAMKDRNPSYMNDKLVSNITLQDNETIAKVQQKLNIVQKKKLKADINEHILQNALKKREQWREEHKLEDKFLFQLFSEFSSMMQIDRTRKNEQDPNSFQNKLHKNTVAHTSGSETYMDSLFPIGNSVSSTKFDKLRKADAHKSHKLTKKDLSDFRIPINICEEFSEVLRPTKNRLRHTVMNACGIETKSHSAKVTYEQFLKMNSFLRYNKGTEDEFIWFCVRLFDPQLCGFTPASHCETIIDLLFDNQDDEGVTTKPPEVKLPQSPHKKMRSTFDKEPASDQDSAADSNENFTTKVAKKKRMSKIELGSQDVESANNEAGQQDNQNQSAILRMTMSQGSSQASSSKNKMKSSSKRAMNQQEATQTALRQADSAPKDESVSSNIKKICYEKGIFKADGFMDPNLLFKAFKEKVVDCEDFKAALK